MKTNRRNILKLGLLKTILASLSWTSQTFAFSATRMRRKLRIAGPLRTTQVILVLSAIINSKILRTSQVMMVTLGKDSSKTQQTTQVMMVVIGNSI